MMMMIHWLGDDLDNDVDGEDDLGLHFHGLGKIQKFSVGKVCGSVYPK